MGEAMRKDRTPRRRRLTLCGVPNELHETYVSQGIWKCRNPECWFVGDHAAATAHVVVNQFVP